MPHETADSLSLHAGKKSGLISIFTEVFAYLYNNGIGSIKRL